MKSLSWTAISALTLALAPARSSNAEEGEELSALLGKLPESRLGLVEGIRRAEDRGGAAISAKFEIDREGRLMLSVYVAAKGLECGSEQNVLSELIGSPAAKAWEPAVEIFKDPPHVARSAEQLALLALSPLPLREIVEKFGAGDGWEPISVTPRLRQRRAVIEGRSVRDGVVREWAVDLLTGSALGEADVGNPVRIPVKRHESVRQGGWALEFGCAGAEDGKGFLYFRIVERPSEIARILVVNSKGESLLAPPPAPDRKSWYELNAGVGFGEPVELWIYSRAR